MAGRKEHIARLRKIQQRLKKHDVTLNREKCQFNVRRGKFLGHIVDNQGTHAGLLKVQAIIDMRPSSNTRELRRFMGMVNYLCSENVRSSLSHEHSSKCEKQVGMNFNPTEKP